MNRFEIKFATKRLIALTATADAIGSEGVSLADAGAFLSYAEQEMLADLDVAKKTKNKFAIHHALSDLVQFHAELNTVGVDDATSLSELIEEATELKLNTRHSEPRDFLTEARFIVSILNKLHSDELAQSYGTRYYDQLAEVLDTLFETLPTKPTNGETYSATELNEILELGILRDRLYRSGNYGDNANANWLVTDSESFPRLGQVIANLVDEVERENSHADEVGSVDALEGFGNNRFDAEQAGAFGCPVAG